MQSGLREYLLSIVGAHEHGELATVLAGEGKFEEVLVIDWL